MIIFVFCNTYSAFHSLFKSSWFRSIWVITLSRCVGAFTRLNHRVHGSICNSCSLKLFKFYCTALTTLYFQSISFWLIILSSCLYTYGTFFFHFTSLPLSWSCARFLCFWKIRPFWNPFWLFFFSLLIVLGNYYLFCRDFADQVNYQIFFYLYEFYRLEFFCKFLLSSIFIFIIFFI